MELPVTKIVYHHVHTATGVQIFSSSVGSGEKTDHKDAWKTHDHNTSLHLRKDDRV
jgi:hypothetical protein